MDQEAVGVLNKPIDLAALFTLLELGVAGRVILVVDDTPDFHGQHLTKG